MVRVRVEAEDPGCRAGPANAISQPAETLRTEVIDLPKTPLTRDLQLFAYASHCAGTSRS